MTTINTAEDFIRVMDSNPEILEAVRARVLTREMLDLPGALQRLSWTLNQFMDSTNKRLDALDARLDTLEAVQAETLKRLGALEESHNALVASQNELRETLNMFMKATDKRLEAIEIEGKTHTTEIGSLKGAMAEILFANRASFLPRRMGYRMKASLSPQDIIDILDNADTSDVSPGDLESFERADSILRVTDSEGADHFIYVEVSYTIYPRDIQRAVDHAERLNRWTGIPAHPAVAGARVNWRSDDAVGRREAFFFQLPERLFTP